MAPVVLPVPLLRLTPAVGMIAHVMLPPVPPVTVEVAVPPSEMVAAASQTRSVGVVQGLVAAATVAGLHPCGVVLYTT